jgi:aminoglycoside phosphotransferase (APT) family kinase protein
VLATLIRCGLLDKSTVCDREVALLDASRSNPVLLLTIDGETRHVVKQQGRGKDARSSFEAESAVYRWLAGERGLAGLAPRARVEALSADRDLLILDAIPESRSLHELIATLNGQLHPLLAQLARLLRRLHSVSARANSGADTLPEHTPWVLTLPSGAIPAFAETNPAAAAAVADLHDRRDLTSLLTAAAAGWRASSAIHGDVKTDNVLVRCDDGRWRVWLIDWELAGWGDPLWDLAGLVEGLITSVILANATPSLDPVMPVTRVALDAYGRFDRDRLLQFVAAKLVQVNVQLAGMDGETDGWTTGPRQQLLQLATSLSADPDRWAESICGNAKGRA